MRFVVLIIACCAFLGCAPQGPPPEPKLWSRVDCQRITGNPELQSELERGRTVCLGRAQAAAVSGTAAMPTGRGLGGAIASGIEQGMAQNQIGSATAVSCMAEHGYLLRTSAEHDAACEAIEAQRRAATPVAAKRLKSPKNN